MELLPIALVIVFLTTASAKPITDHQIGRRDADIITESSSSEESSSESNQLLESSASSESSDSESSDSESSEESSEDIRVNDQTTQAMTTIPTGDGTPEPDTMSTDEPTVTPRARIPTTPVAVTSPGNVTGCVTLEIPTPAPITEKRGDN